MRVRRFVELGLVSALFGCAANRAQVGSSIGEDPGPAQPAASDGAGAAGEGEAPERSAPKAAAPAVAPAEEPPPDPAVVRALVNKTGEPSDAAETDNALHLRLEVAPAPAGERWLVAVVNRGTAAVKVQFDPRRLSLVLTPPEDSKKPSEKWRAKPAPIHCKLPDGFGGSVADPAWRELEPGEGLVQAFDPRLYCVSANGDAQLSTGQRVTVKLGYAPKPARVVWKQGKRTELPSLQQAPFIAEPTTPPSTPIDPEHDPRVKELVAGELLLTPEMTAAEGEDDPSLPLSLVLVRGSDASSELTATATVQVRARQKSLLYFRRELVSFIVHGPDGIRGCDPEPDNRIPDRQAYTPLGPKQSVSATSLLAEMCPKYTFARPGLYLVSARLDALRDGAEFGLSAFTGTLESRRQALVRIRTGDFPALPPPEPIRVRVGQ